MTVLKNAPLLEVVLAFRWGAGTQEPKNGAIVLPGSGDDDFLFGEFRAAARDRGYGHVERTPGIPNVALPGVVSHRFRKGPGTWPLFQLGLGILTVNQINQGYDWEPFAQVVLEGFALLGKAAGSSLSESSDAQIELFYQDGFTFKEGQTATEFLGSFPLYLKVPDPVLNTLSKDKSFGDVVVAFSAKLADPLGTLLMRMVQGEITGKAGIVLETYVRSSGPDCPSIVDSGAVSKWLDRAHEVQRAVFRSIISPAAKQS